MILLMQNSSQQCCLAATYVAYYTDCHGLKIKCPLRGRLIFCAHGIMFAKEMK